MTSVKYQAVKLTDACPAIIEVLAFQRAVTRHRSNSGPTLAVLSQFSNDLAFVVKFSPEVMQLCENLSFQQR